MEKNKRKIAFTFPEALLVLIIMGVIGVLYTVGMKLYDPTQKGNDVKANKILENLDQTITLIIAQHSPMFTLEYLNDSQGSFTVTDANKVATTTRLANLFKQYLVIMDMQQESRYDSYYSSPILDYKKVSIGSTLNSIYSDFMMSENGTIYGFRVYGSCSATENNANPPLYREKYVVKNICGSIFYDVNAYKGPNKLGSDQYIIPFDINGTEVKKQS